MRSKSLRYAGALGLFGLASVAMVLLTVAPVHAQEYYVAFQGEANAIPGFGPGGQDMRGQSGNLAQLSYSTSLFATASAIDNIDAQDSATGFTQDTASIGNLQVYSSSNASGPDLAAAAVFGNVYFNDTLTVTSATLAAGTTVTLSGSMVVSDSVSASNTSPGDAQIAAVFAPFGLSYDDYTNASSGVPNLLQATIQATVGDSISLNAVLGGQTNPGSSGLYDGQVSAIAEADVSFYVDSETPGVSLVSASGHDYSSAAAAPEPDDLVLLASGLLPLGFAVRRRNRPGGPRRRCTEAR